MKKMINSNTAMLVGSMPSFPHGACDPIQEIAKVNFSQLLKQIK